MARNVTTEDSGFFGSPPGSGLGFECPRAICFNNLAAYDILYTLVAQKSPQTTKVSAVGDSGPEACFTIVVVGAIVLELKT